MGTVLASKIAADAAFIMFDPTYVRFDETTDWLVWINAGQREACTLKPDINTVNENQILQAGTKQSVGSDIGMIKITRNMGTDGTTPGKTIRFVDMDHFDRHNPGWHEATPNAEVEVYMYDTEDPGYFYNYPPQPTSGFGYVEKVAPALPDDISLIGDAIDIADVYENVLLAYAVYRAQKTNAKHSEFAKRDSIESYNRFVTLLGRKDLVEKVQSPKVKEAKNG